MYEKISLKKFFVNYLSISPKTISIAQIVAIKSDKNAVSQFFVVSTITKIPTLLKETRIFSEISLKKQEK